MTRAEIKATQAGGSEKNTTNRVRDAIAVSDVDAVSQSSKARTSTRKSRKEIGIMSENTRFFANIIPSLRASVTDILDRQHMQGQRIDVPVCGGVTCWWHAAQGLVPTPQTAAKKNDKPIRDAQNTDACADEIGAPIDSVTEPSGSVDKALPPAPVIFELHGGGFVLGDARKDDAFCKALRDGTGAHVVGIHYPKAPEQTYPAAVNAVWEVLVWFAQHAAQYGMDARRFALLGFSSGGNLAAVAAVRAACQTAPFTVVSQVLHYPFLDAVAPPTQKNPQPWDLAAEVMDAFTELYCAGASPQDPMISPVCAPPAQLRGTAPALILTAGRDALQGEGEQYARLLQAAGVQAEHTAVPHAHHGYVEDWFNPACYEATPEDTRAWHEAQFGGSAQRALDESVRFLREHFYQ